ncbi:MAG TPA: hypothetical protein VGR55_12250 [Candidatus Acidoferrum sp.]|nr:hypothetical protein [Candidatus Acidoferrum sp.]
MNLNLGGRNAATLSPRGTFISSTMIVIMIANTPSLKASSRPLPMTEIRQAPAP